MIRAIVPGSYDPVTCGHLYIINAAARIFNEVIVAIGNNPIKKSFIPIDYRLSLIKECDLPTNVKVDVFEGLLADYCKEKDINIIVRGVRSVTDFEYELNMVHVNSDLSGTLQTIFVPANLNLSMVSSSIIRDIWNIKHKIPEQFAKYIPMPVIKYLNGE